MKELFSWIFLSLTIFYFACGEDTPETPNQPTKPPQFGAVSGTITDAQTKNAIPDVTVTLLAQTVKTDINGKYNFIQVGYAENLTLTVNDADYIGKTETFTLNMERVVLDIALVPASDVAAELRRFLGTFSDLIESMDENNFEAIQALFSETYFASDDAVTRFGLATGVVPANFENVIPSATKLFAEFDRIQFQFLDTRFTITHARKVSGKLKLEVITETGARPDRKELIAECQINFSKEERDWKMVFWQLFEVDVRL